MIYIDGEVLRTRSHYILLISAFCLFISAGIYLSQGFGRTELKDRILGIKMEFHVIEKGYYSRHTKSAYYIIQDEDSWVNVWYQHDNALPKRSPPKIDFENTTIIAVFMGEFNTGGYSIEIKAVVNFEQSVVVEVEKTYPAKGSIVTEAFSQPYHIIKLDKIEKDIKFETVEIIS